MTKTLNLQSSAQLMLPELIIDSFAGGGGASAGIERALGRGPDLAINHEPHAVMIHQLNHPKTLHLCQDILEVDPSSICAGRRVGLLWASPDCTHFSRAKSGRPVSKKNRGLAWAVVEWAKTVSPRVLILENVQEFEQWGPIGRDNLPIKSRKGETFRKWVAALRSEGYAVEWKMLVASDYGVPSTRERLFVIARNDGDPITWPEPTHADEPLSALEVLDFGTVAPTVNPAKRGNRRLAAKTMERIQKGTARYVTGRTLDEAELVDLPDGTEAVAWIAKHYGGMVGNDVSRPLATITARDHHGLVLCKLGRKGQRSPAWIRKVLGADTTVDVDGVKRPIIDIGHRMLQPHELAAGMGFGQDYVLAGTKEQQQERIGNAVCPPLAEALVRANFKIEPVAVELANVRIARKAVA